MKMRTLTAVLLGAGLFAMALPAEAHDGPGGGVGVGLGVGAPTGLTLEVSATRSSSFEAALGIDAFDEAGGYGHLVYKLALAQLASTRSVHIPFYTGIGGYVFDRDRGGDGLDLGVRIPMGVNFDFQRAPIQLFVELALGVDVIDGDDHNRDAWIGGYGGVRFWF